MNAQPVRVSLKRGGTITFDPTSKDFTFRSKTGSETRGNLAFELEHVLPSLPEVFTTEVFRDRVVELEPAKGADIEKLEKRLSYRLSFLMGLGYIERISPYGRKPWEFVKRTPDFESGATLPIVNPAQSLAKDELIKVLSEARYHFEEISYHTTELSQRLDALDRIATRL